MDLHGLIIKFGPHLVAAIAIALAILASCHAILYKRDARAAVIWTGLVWLSPFFGALAYFSFGINRIRTRASSLRARVLPRRTHVPSVAAVAEELTQLLPPASGHLVELMSFMDRTCMRPLVTGNTVEMLDGGDEAFPAMIAAINRAKISIGLSSYIFDDDDLGREIAEALAAAVKRGVTVRVLVDDMGARYSRPTIEKRLRRLGVPVATFLPSLISWRRLSINLRNHRKILLIDGRQAFTGGINIRGGTRTTAGRPPTIHDLHFACLGPVVAQIAMVFAEDWDYVTGEELAGDTWFPQLSRTGTVAARAIADGPDDDLDSIRWALLGALSMARRRVSIVTPYFLPDQDLITQLGLAATRGVEVEIFLPEKNNLPYVHWAAMAQLWQVLGRGCKVYLVPPPFDHSKVTVVDGAWTLMGSANWDPRSLRLNFELDVECFSVELAASVSARIEARRARARCLTLADVDARPLAVRLRDGVARLFTPYL